MKKMTKRLMCLLLAGMTLFSLAACGGDSGANDSTPPSGSESPSGSVAPSSSQPSGTSEAVEITFYPRDANLSSGVVGGFKGDYFASRGFRLNVWAYSDEKTNGMLASGDLPDVMFIPEQSLDVMIQNGMLLNLDDYLDDMPCLQAYEPIHAALNYVREFKSAGTGSVYGIPTSIGENFAKYKYVDATERNALKLHWANYVAAGSPEITDFYSLIDAMEKMMEVTPQDAEGNPFFGTVLNAGSDTTHWACMTMWYRMQGYLENQLPYSAV